MTGKRMVWGAVGAAMFLQAANAFAGAAWMPTKREFAAAERRQECRGLRAVLTKEGREQHRRETFEQNAQQAVIDAHEQLLACGRSQGVRNEPTAGFEDALSEVCPEAYDRWIEQGTKLQFARADGRSLAKSLLALEERVKTHCPSVHASLDATSVESRPTTPFDR